MERDEEPPLIGRALLAHWARGRILLVLLGALFISLINVSIVNVALPTIQQSLHASQADLQWVLSGYALTFGVILVAAGRAGDILGRAGFFIIGVTIFTLASTACGLARNPVELNVARFIQGLGSGFIAPQAVGMLQKYFRGPARGRAFGYFGSMVGVSVAIGPVLGGVLIGLGGPDLGWRLAFLVNAPIGLAVIVFAWLWLQHPLFKPRASWHVTSGDSDHRIWRTLDPLGSLLLGLAVFAVLYPFMQYRGAPWAWLLLPASAVLTLLWIVWERHLERTGGAPMVDLRIFASASFSNGALLMALYFLGMTSIWVIVALYFQDGLGKTALQAGLVSVPASIISAFAAHWAGARVHRWGRKVVVGGLWVAIVGIALCIVVVAGASLHWLSPWWLVGALALVGVAQGAVISPNQALTLAEVPIEYAGSSGAVMQTGQRMGTSVGIALITTVLFLALESGSWALAMVAAFGAIEAVFVLALLLGYKDLRAQRARQAP